MKTHPITVLHLISSLGVGGAEKLLVSMLKDAASQTGIYYVAVVMNAHVHPTLREELVQAGFPVYFLNRREGEKHPQYLIQLLEIIRRHGVQVIHAHNHGSKFWAMLCRVCVPRLKMVFTVHSTRIIPKLTQLERVLHRRLVHHNIAISNAVLAECQAGGIAPVTQIYNGIETRRFAPFLQTKPNRPELQIVQVARLTHAHKGQDILIRALSLCKKAGIPFQCRFIGSVCDYDHASYGFLRQLVAEHGLSEQVEFLTDRTDIPELLSQADLFVLPSRYEGLGLVVLEAMAARVPVIASDVDGLAELIADGVNGFLFHSQDPHHLFEKIRFAQMYPEAVNAVAARAFDTVQSFDIARMRDDYEQIYIKLLQKKISATSMVKDTPFQALSISSR